MDLADWYNRRDNWRFGGGFAGYTFSDLKSSVINVAQNWVVDFVALNSTQEFLLDSPSLKLKSLPPLSLYIHIPWCIKKCPYCDFNSHEIHNEENQVPEDEYVNALIRDLESALPNVWGRRLTSVFFGGGTPSLLGAKTIDRLLSAVRTLLP